MPTSKPRLLMVANTDKFFISHRLCIALEARKRGYEVKIATLDTGLSHIIKETGIPYISIPGTVAGTNPLKEIKTVRFLRKLYLREKPDIIHHIAVKPVIYGSIAARLSKMPAFINALSGLGYTFIEGEKRSFSRWISKTTVTNLVKYALGAKNSKLILQNRDDIKMFTAQGWIEESRIVWIRGSGVDMDLFRFMPEPQKYPLVVMLPSRMLWDKGIGEFVEAARILKSQWQENVKFVMVGGTGFENPAVIPTETIEAWVQEGVIEWWGELEAMETVLPKANIIVLPSYREGLPKVLIEAQAVGRAVITTDVPGCREVIQDGVTGYLVPAKSVQPLVDKIDVLLRDKVLREKMGQAGRNFSEEKFSLNYVLNTHFELYEHMLSLAKNRII